MQIVINIPEATYDLIKNNVQARRFAGEAFYAIRRGTVLPKGHGALKDVEKIEDAFWNDNLIDKRMDSLDNGESQKMRRAMIRTMHIDVPTIVEADEETNE